MVESYRCRGPKQSSYLGPAPVSLFNATVPKALYEFAQNLLVLRLQWWKCFFKPISGLWFQSEFTLIASWSELADALVTWSRLSMFPSLLWLIVTTCSESWIGPGVHSELDSCAALDSCLHRLQDISRDVVPQIPSAGEVIY